MNTRLVEHRGVVARVDGGKAFVAMTGGCSSCGHGASCGIGRIADSRTAKLVAFEVGAEIGTGDHVGIVLRESCLTVSALVGYLFPAFTLLLGAWAGDTVEGSDVATALGALVGFVAALAAQRALIRLVPGLLPAPRLIRWPNPISQQELHHER